MRLIKPDTALVPGLAKQLYDHENKAARLRRPRQSFSPRAASDWFYRGATTNGAEGRSRQDQM